MLPHTHAARGGRRRQAVPTTTCKISILPILSPSLFLLAGEARSEWRAGWLARREADGSGRRRRRTAVFPSDEMTSITPVCESGVYTNGRGGRGQVLHLRDNLPKLLSRRRRRNQAKTVRVIRMQGEVITVRKWVMPSQGTPGKRH